MRQTYHQLANSPLGFVLGWGLVSTLGLFIGTILLPLRDMTLASLPTLIGWGLLDGLVIGLCIGILQGAFLRRKVEINWKQWIAFTVIGFSTALIFFGIAVYFNGVPTYSADSGISGEIISSEYLTYFIFVTVAISQYFVLRDSFNSAWLWILASFASTALDILISFPIVINSHLNWFIVVILAKSIHGFIGGITLWYLVTRKQGLGKQKAKT